MSANHMLKRYLQTQQQTMPQEQVLLALLGGVETACESAAGAIDERRIADKAKQCDRALAILSELQLALSTDADSKAADGLLRLYGFAQHQILTGSSTMNSGSLREAARVIVLIKESFSAAISQHQQEEIERLRLVSGGTRA